MREFVGWLIMQKEDRSGRVVIEVHKQDNLIYLNRQDREPHSVRVGRALRLCDQPASFWSCRAAIVWNDLEIEKGFFRPLSLGYPDQAELPS
jgi:hypothetical protein